MKEQGIQKAIVKFLEKELKAYVIVTIITGKSGVPDIVASVNGRFLGIEVKLPTTMDTVSPLQLHNIQLIKDSGSMALVASSVDDVRKYLFTHGIAKIIDNEIEV